MGSASKCKKSSFPLSKLFPNIVTIIGLCMGLFALKYAMLEDWHKAALFVIIAAAIDGIDGRLARMLNASSTLGAHLDSLADFYNFSVAPALISYMWITSEIKGLGWTAALFFIICGAIRLARFNVSLEDSSLSAEERDKFFVGMPAPCAASLSVFPMVLTFLFAEKFDSPLFEITPIAVIIYITVIAVLMVSTLPTVSIKRVKVKREYVPATLAVCGLIIVSTIVEPWLMLTVIGLTYLATVPTCIVLYYMKKNPA